MLQRAGSPLLQYNLEEGCAVRDTVHSFELEYNHIHLVRTGVSDHLKTLNQDAQDSLRSYVLRVVVHKVSEEGAKTCRNKVIHSYLP